MYSYPSRNEVRETKLYMAAEEGLFSLESVLYSSEIKKLNKNGFAISDVKPFTKPGLYTATISWNKAFGMAIPHVIFAYTHRIIDSVPSNVVTNLAQELYLVAKRSSLSNI